MHLKKKIAQFEAHTHFGKPAGTRASQTKTSHGKRKIELQMS